MPETPKYVYSFGRGSAEGRADMRDLLGGKGANLAEMSSIGIPVPPGFTITTEVCAKYYDRGRLLPDDVKPQVESALARMEDTLGKKFGNSADPLLVSVRSGAALSMPGMMNTILNLGLTDASVEGLARKTGNPRFAYDGYRRLIDMFGSTAMDVEHQAFEHELASLKAQRSVKLDTELGAADLKELVARYKAVYERHVGEPFPQDPKVQLWKSITAVFNSWMGNKAVEYRRIERITGLSGTAVSVQAMVFGNTGNQSGTGVAFTRDPNTGEDTFYGDYLINAQGEDVVAGIRTPEPISQLEGEMPAVYNQLLDIRRKLEAHYKEMQDIEFTVQDGVLYMLQTRTGKRTGTSAVRIAVELVSEGKIDEKTAIKRINPETLNHLLMPQIDPKHRARVKPLARGISASPGAAVGKIVLSAEAAQRAIETDPTARIMLLRKETSPEDVAGMNLAQGILTSTGGKASHAAVVARGWGKPCIVGCEAITINEAAGTIMVEGQTIKAGEYITIDGSTGEVWVAEMPTIDPNIPDEFFTLMKWADQHRTLKVRTNADTPKDAAKARDFGAEGIGLCRTEHMFFGEHRIVAMRKMILAEDQSGREAALAELEPFQREDFIGIFDAMDGLPVTIRLLDPPLHEFLPHDQKGQAEVASQLRVKPERVRDRVNQLHEFNPMLGFRGCRLPIVYPEIGDMQVRAIIDAAIAVKKRGKSVLPEIMIPLVGTVEELAILKKRAIAIADERIKKSGVAVDYLVGTMIEVPRACLTAAQAALSGGQAITRDK
jgi:pyruvate,orthophosphate dikinase